MGERVRKICALLESARVFADVGCDHGYMAAYMLDNGLCERAYVTDVSADSLKKAQTLLAPHIAAGRCVPIVCDGLAGIPERCDLVLIAGMGGEETVKILSRGELPPRFLLQPMKNTEKVRRFLVARGAKICRDFTFSDRGKYYDVLLGSGAGGDVYTEREFRFGRDNLNGRSEPFAEQMRAELKKTELRLENARSGGNASALLACRDELREILHEIERDL